MNSWRIALANAAAAAAVAAGRPPRTSSIITPSVPLHLDGHHGADPVRFRQPYGDAAARMIYDFAARVREGDPAAAPP